MHHELVLFRLSINFSIVYLIFMVVMKYPKNDMELRLLCVELSTSMGGVELEKAKEIYEFISAASSSKPSVWRRLVLAFSRWYAKLRR